MEFSGREKISEMTITITRFYHYHFVGTNGVKGIILIEKSSAGFWIT